MIEYKVDDKEISASFFIYFVNQIWQGTIPRPCYILAHNRE